MNEQDHQQERRGVLNPRVIDLISPGAAPDEVVLLILEDREWGAAASQLEEIQEKFNNYLDYILDGHFLAQYPQYQGKKIVIQFDCVTPPQGEDLSLLEAMQQYAQSIGLRLEVTVGKAK